MTCDEVEELAGAYALGALPEDELEAVEAHVGSCTRTHTSLLELSQTAGLLALACEESLPSPSLGRRIREAASADLDAVPRAPTRFRPSDAPAPRAARSSRPFAARQPLWLAAAALFAALALGLGVWGATEHAQLSQRATTLQANRTVLTALAEGATVVPISGSGARQPALLVQPRDGGSAYLVADVPDLSGGKVYEAWYINGQTVALAGAFDGSPNGPQVVRLSGPLTGVGAVAVTIEPKGSTTPTGPKILERTL